MAGDWIKMRVDLGDDPAVVQIAARLDVGEDEVVGKLHRLWSWADRHTADGTAPAITARWVDRYVSCQGFAEAMVLVAWISFSEDGVAFPHFDRHNGESAKRRGEAAIRQRLSRKNRDDGVTGVERTAMPRPFVRHVLVRDNYTCVFCGTASTAAREESRKAILSIDHLVPATRGGLEAVENLVCACRSCNGEKNDRTPEEWGVQPTFLQPGVFYKEGQFVSQKKCDTDVTREEKRREEEIPREPTVLVAEASPSTPYRVPNCPTEELVALYHRHLPALPVVEVMNDGRKRSLSARWRDVCGDGKFDRAAGLDWFSWFFERVAGSDFLMGRTAGKSGQHWRADFDFLTTPSKFVKVVEGRYHQGATA